MRFWKIAAACSILVWSHVAFAQWRDEPLKIIVPFAAGGAVDQVARIIAGNMPSEMNAIVDNRSGAGGDIGVTDAARAAPDGKTLLLHTSSLVINAVFRGKSSETEHMFEPIARVGDVKYVLVIPAKFPAASFSEFINVAKDGRRLSYGSTGPGTTLQIAAEMLKEATGIPGVHIPYRGLNPAFTDLLGGNIDFMVTSVTGVLPYVVSGALRPLATFNDQRAVELPQVPTTVELGFPELKISNWYGLFITASTPVDKRRELEGLLLPVLQSPHVQAQLAAAGIRGVQPADPFKKSIEQEFLTYDTLVKHLGIAAE